MSVLKKLILVSSGYLVKLICLIAFLLQTTKLLNGMINPRDTLTGTERVAFEKIDFPLIFKVCIQPGFDDEELKNMGYANNVAYFNGQSRFNASIFGWAGHTPDGKVMSNVSGKDN